MRTEIGAENFKSDAAAYYSNNVFYIKSNVSPKDSFQNCGRRKKYIG